MGRIHPSSFMESAAFRVLDNLGEPVRQPLKRHTIANQRFKTRRRYKKVLNEAAAELKERSEAKAAEDDQLPSCRQSA